MKKHQRPLSTKRTYINTNAPTFYGTQGTDARTTVFTGRNKIFDPNFLKDLSNTGTRIGPGPGAHNLQEESKKPSSNKTTFSMDKRFATEPMKPGPSDYKIKVKTLRK